MLWTCPSCRRQINEDGQHTAPQPNVIYRCYVCRLDLVLDTKHSKLTTPQRGDPNDDGDVAARLVERGRILVRSYRRIKQKGPSHRRIEVT